MVMLIILLGFLYDALPILHQFLCGIGNIGFKLILFGYFVFLPYRRQVQPDRSFRVTQS